MLAGVRGYYAGEGNEGNEQTRIAQERQRLEVTLISRQVEVITHRSARRGV